MKKAFVAFAIAVVIGVVAFLSVDMKGVTVVAEDPSYELTADELEYIQNNKQRQFHVGLAPYEGIDLFVYKEREYGYLEQVVDLFQQETGLNFVVDKDKPWGEAYQGLFEGSVDVLFGANATEERLKVMSFTKPVIKYPYVVLAEKDHASTLGDLDGRSIGFVEGDMVIDLFREQYEYIEYTVYEFPDPASIFEAINHGLIDGGITASTEIVDELIYEYQTINIIAEITDITSDMTFSTLKENETMAAILDKILRKNEPLIDEMIVSAAHINIRKVLNMSDEELAWLEENPSIRVGVASDYLPLDYANDDGTYGGVAGRYFMQFANLIGIQVEPVVDSFDNLMVMFESREIDVLNLAKTDDREAFTIYTEPLSPDRDVIYGRKDVLPVYEVYGLESQKVAVIEGFWHEEFLLKNLKQVEIIYTNDIEETLRLVSNGEADYFIDNHTVAEYYIDGLGYNNIVQKGVTSSDSFLYFGMTLENGPLVNLFNRAVPLMDFSQAEYDGVLNAPSLRNIMNRNLMFMLLASFSVLIIAFVVIVYLMRASIRNRAENEILKEKERLMYLDPLTDVYNRAFYNQLEEKMDSLQFPQVFIVMDLNGLKHANDTYGHEVGDRMLKVFAKGLMKVFGEGCVMRTGGDEFFIFIEAGNLEETKENLKELKGIVDHSVIQINQDQTMSGPTYAVGIYVRESLDVLPRTALHYADQTMYKMKKQMKSEKEVD